MEVLVQTWAKLSCILHSTWCIKLVPESSWAKKYTSDIQVYCAKVFSQFFGRYEKSSCGNPKKFGVSISLSWYTPPGFVVSLSELAHLDNILRDFDHAVWLCLCEQMLELHAPPKKMTSFNLYVNVKHFVCKIGENADILLSLYDAKEGQFFRSAGVSVNTDVAAWLNFLLQRFCTICCNYLGYWSLVRRFTGPKGH